MFKILILAGGSGRRMKKLNNIPKVFQYIDGKPMLCHLIDKFFLLGFKDEDINIIFSNETYEYSKKIFNNRNFNIVIQKSSNGTGGAVLAALEDNNLFLDDDILLICNGDNPFISIDTLQNIMKYRDPTLSIMKVDNPSGYGRIILENDMIVNIIEEKDCNNRQKEIDLVNTAIYIVPFNILKVIIKKIDTDNAQNEYYLTDIVTHHSFKPFYINNIDECFNINTPEQLETGKELYKKINYK